jgi:uncharacterized membrane protein
MRMSVQPNLLMRLDWATRLSGWTPWIAAIFVIAGLVHIVSVLAMPALAPLDSFSRLAATTPLGRLVILDNGEPGKELLPYEDPATSIAICRYDLAQGPLRLKSTFDGEGLVLMSFRNRFGTAFYAMTDRGTSRGRLDVVVATRAQLDNIEAGDSEDEVPSDLRLLSPSLEGFVMLRALALEPGQRSVAEARLRAVSCTADE